MDPLQKPSSALELWLQDVQSYIYKVTKGPMHHGNFKFDRNSFHYNRKSKNSQDELSIIFLSQFPVSYRIGFQLEIWHPEIRQIKESFMSDILNRESFLCSIILFMKDFPSQEAPDEIMKDFTVCTHRDLFLAGAWLAQKLQYELVPLCDQMSSIKHMDDFFQARPQWSLSTRSGGNLCTDLITAKLNKKRDYHQRYQELRQAVRLEIESRSLNPEVCRLLDLCYESIR